MRKRFPIYTRLLSLYPKTYRQEYGSQLEQTLADMLDDEPSRFGRLYIWSQVALDFPVTVYQQNIMALRGNKTMQKYVPKLSKRAFVGILVAAIAAMGLGFYQFGRSGLVPGVAKIVYGSSLRGLYEDERKALGDPSRVLLGVSSDAELTCVSIYEGIKVHVSCDTAMQQYGQLRQGQEGKLAATNAASEVEKALVQSGYEKGIDGGSNGVTLSSLIGGTYQGIDYSPDAFYSKKVGDALCTFQVTVAYSSPKPAAINVRHVCTREFDPFGVPPMIQSAQNASDLKPTSGVVFNASSNFSDEEKKTIQERITGPKMFYEQNILRHTDLRSIEISRSKPGYTLQTIYAKDEPNLGFVFGAEGGIEHWVPQLCDPGGCREYPEDFKTAFPETFAAYTACQASTKEQPATQKCVSG